ncbi:annetocin receptor-like [Mya arenaria]|uniref:annetocin receptor-like n=1 Tax=Mya arenaria TaxID=6604 RepID=UPI0022E0C477|nr:annetocin receptor-like [Mya arenaria]
MGGNDSDEIALNELNKDKINEYALAIAFASLMIVLGSVGNIFSVIYYGFKAPKTSTNVIITGLAIVDLIACFVFIDEIFELCFTVTYRSRAACKILYFVNEWLVVTSGFILLLVAVDRYRKICRPFQWQLTGKSSKLSFAAIILVAMIYCVRNIALLDIVEVQVPDQEGNKMIRAYYCTHSKDPDLSVIIEVFHKLDFASTTLVIIILAILYSLISKTLWTSRRTIRKSCSIKRAHGNFDVSVHNAEEGELDVSISDTDLNTVDFTASLPRNIQSDFQNNDIRPSFQNEGKIANQLKTDQRDSTITFSCTAKCNEDVKPKATNNMATDSGSPFRNDSKLDSKSTLKRQKIKSIKQARRERKVTIMMIIVTVVSLASFSPYFIVTFGLKQADQSADQEFNVGVQIALRSFMLNNAINPYIMGALNAKYRYFVKRALCCLLYKQ